MRPKRPSRSRALMHSASGHRHRHPIGTGSRGCERRGTVGLGAGEGLDPRGQPVLVGAAGHQVLDPNGPECYCGARGCVETLLSGPALEAEHVAAGGPPCDAAAVAVRAAAGDERAARVLERWLDRFGRGLANVVNILDPSVVVLGGGLSNIAALYGRGREAVARRVFNDELTTPIVQNTLGDSAGVIGAALLAAASGRARRGT